MTVIGDCAREPEVEAAANSQGAVHAGGYRSGSFGAFHRIGLPVVLWIVFVNVAHHYYGKGLATDLALHDVVEAELASRRCPDLRFDPASFRVFAQEHGFNHADIYQKRSARLQKAADHLDRRLRDDPGGECQRMFDLYGGTGSALHLLTRA